MSNTVVNSSAKNNFFTAAGSAIGATTQPRINAPAFAGIKDSSINASLPTGIISTSPFKFYTGYDNVSIMEGTLNKLRGVAGNTIIRSEGISGNARVSIAKVNHIRTHLISSGIRTGFLNIMTGKISGVTVGDLDDQTACGTDNESNSNAAIPGGFTYNYDGKKSNQNYNKRTQT